jgi:hypothetical protein
MSDSATESLDARVRRLEDLEAIRRLLLDYGTFVDTRQFERCSQLFTDTAEYDVGFTTVIGPAGALGVLHGMTDGLMKPEPGDDFHVYTNFSIDLDGDRATARSFWQFIAPDERGHPCIAHFGHYDDVVVREGSAWKFQRRAALRDIGVPPEEFA